jgi:EAL domain-containing protein (putative c-di-GMP-specific phosphodiesterase class I)
MGHQLSLRTAIGYAVQTDEDTTGDDLVRQADLAMYGAKRQREGGPVAFSHLLETATRDAALIEQGLRRALDRPGELSVVYQPIAAMDGRMVRAEALARWTSPELGSVPPNQFIAVAERTGLIIDLGRRLIDLVCRDLAAHPDLKVSLNVSPLQLMAPDFIPGLVRDLSRYGVDVPRVEIELTESVIVDDTRLAAERFEELHAAGFSIALDDFGTGYSSMGYLARLRFHTLKIDRSFVSKVLATDQDAAVVDGMIRIAHGLGLQVVCEGIETAEELGRLREFGCDLAQGYHLDRPLPIHALAGRWLPHPTPSGAVVGL